MKFRDLKADEIDVRVQNISEKGFSVLLYKDARADMTLLDETVGAMNWKREHARDNANCIVSIWDDEKSQWISKEDTGKESFSQKEKGLASDSFKRACFNWGIGRELYTAPFIWISDTSYTKKGSNGKPTIYEKFKVSNIEIVDKNITKIEIVDSKGKVIYQFGFNESNKKPKKDEKTEAPKKEPTEEDKRKKAIKAINAKCNTDELQKWLLDVINVDFNKNSLEELTEEELKRMWGRVK